MTYENKTTWRFLTDGGIRYRVVNLEGEATQAATRFTETILLSADDLDAFIDESFPLPEIIDGISIYNNRAYPGLSNLRTSRIQIKGHLGSKPIDPYEIDAAANANTYQDVLMLAIDYENDLEKDPNNPETYLNFSVNASGEFIHVTGGNADFGRESAGTKVGPNKNPVTPATIFVPKSEWTIRQRQVSHKYFKDTLIHRLRNGIGRINSKTLPPPFFGAYPETMLMVGWSLQQEFQREVLDPDFVGPPQSFERPMDISISFEEQFIQGDANDYSLKTEKVSYKTGDKVIEGTVFYHGWNETWKQDEGWVTFFCRQNATANSTQSRKYNTYDHRLLFKGIVADEVFPVVPDEDLA